MDMKKLIQQMTDLEGSQAKNTQLNEETQVAISGNSGEEIANMITSLQGKAGIGSEEISSDSSMPMRQDMERLRGIMSAPEVSSSDDLNADNDDEEYISAIDTDNSEDLDEYANEPDEEYSDHHYMTKDLSGGINRRKKSYSDAEDGDNPMAVHEEEADPAVIAKVQELSKINDIDVLKKEVYDLVKNTKMNKAKKMQLMRNTENSRTIKNLIGLLWNTFVLGAEGKHAPGSSWSKRFENTEDEMRESIKDQLYAALSEKKAKPDYIDLDDDGNTEEPMKKAAKDKKSKKKNKVAEAGPARTQQNLMYMELDAINSGKGKKYFLMDYEMPFGVHNPQAFNKQIKEHPIVQKLKDQGYVGPKQIAGWDGDIDTAISQAEETADEYKDLADQRPAQHHDSQRRLQRLKAAKSIIDSGKLIS
jgi:hypothetical protein